MQKRHLDPLRYFNEQSTSTKKHILPFIQSVKKIENDLNVLEIGCGEAGNLKPFLELGCICTGVDFSTSKIEKGKEYYANHPQNKNINLISNDIYQVEEFQSKFDIIIIRDVIEHIHDQDKFLKLTRNLLRKDGIIFVAFPPWQSPFGGHQQMCDNKIASVLPFYHILPKAIYTALLKLFGENELKIKGLLEIKETGISLDRFEKLVNKNDYHINKEIIYFINPNYEIKFGLKPRKLYGFIAKIPYIRNYFSTCGYYVLSLN